MLISTNFKITKLGELRGKITDFQDRIVTFKNKKVKRVLGGPKQVNKIQNRYLLEKQLPIVLAPF